MRQERVARTFGLGVAAGILAAGVAVAQPSEAQPPAPAAVQTEQAATASATEVEAVPLEAIELLILDPADQRAVLRIGSGAPVVVEPEDSIERTRAIVESVTGDKLVVAYTTDEEPPARLTAWIYKDRSGKNRSRVQYLDPRAPVEPLPTQPLYLEQIPEDAPEPTGPMPPPPPGS